jgi:hypothetical protein
MPGERDRSWPHVLSAVSALYAGDGDGFGTHMAVGGPEAVLTLGALAAGMLERACEAEGIGDPDLLLADMRAAVLGQDDGG